MYILILVFEKRKLWNERVNLIIKKSNNYQLKDLQPLKQIKILFLIKLKI
jgi:hypothetical protein